MVSSHTAYVWDERFLLHDTGESGQMLADGTRMQPVEHYSNNRITNRAAQLIRGTGLEEKFFPVPVREATVEELTLFHTPEYLQHVQEVCAAGGMLDDQTRVCPGSWEAALLSAGGALEITSAVVTGQVRNGYALLRPIGHHAMPDQGMGFCVFNNVVIAALHAQRAHGVGRIAIVDWDVHHGNGTQTGFWDDPDVLFISLHQDNWYPGGWGAASDIGSDGAKGATVNIPLPAGTGNIGYLKAFDRLVLPIIRQFAPELIFVSAGQDPNMSDPLGRMMVTATGFHAMASRMRELADDICDGRLVGMQEGGYSPHYAPYCTLAVVEGLSGQETGIGDSWAGSSEHDRALIATSPAEDDAIDDVIAAQCEYWSLS